MKKLAFATTLILSALGASTAALPAAAVEPEVNVEAVEYAPQSVSGCSIYLARAVNPDYAKGTCPASGYGWVQLEIVCYYFDSGDDVHGATAWYYKSQGTSITLKASCPSNRPFLRSAKFDFTK